MEVINEMRKYRVSAKVIIDDVVANSEKEAVDRVAQIYSQTLIVISATAKLAPRKIRKND